MHFCENKVHREWKCLSNSQLFYPSSEGLKNLMKYLLSLVNTICWIFESLSLGRMTMSWALLRTDHWKFRRSQLPQFCFCEYLSLKLTWIFLKYKSTPKSCCYTFSYIHIVAQCAKSRQLNDKCKINVSREHFYEKKYHTQTQ